MKISIENFRIPDGILINEMNMSKKIIIFMLRK